MTKRELEITDPLRVKGILDNSKVLHLALCENNMPYVLAMNYGYEFVDEKLHIYLHGALEGKKLDMIRANANCSFEMDCNVNAFSGEVACQYGTSYESVIGFGKAAIVEDVNEKMRMLSVLMKTQTGKDFEFNEKLVSIVSIIHIEVDEYTAKARPMPKNMSMQK